MSHAHKAMLITDPYNQQIKHPPVRLYIRIFILFAATVICLLFGADRSVSTATPSCSYVCARSQPIGSGTSGAELTAFETAFCNTGGQPVLGCATDVVRFDGFTSFTGTVGHYQTTD